MNNRNKKNPNIKDVAKMAGVSAMTVSSYLRKSAPMKDETAERIQNAIDELGYIPNYLARSLRQNKTYAIGLIVGNVLSKYYSVIAKAVEDTAHSYNYSLILCNGDDSAQKEKKYLNLLRSRVDGIILTPTNKNRDYINLLIESGQDIVLIDRLLEGVNCDAVVVNNRESSYNAVRFLISKGYRKIGIIDGLYESTTGRERLGGYLDALKDSKINRDENLIKIGDFKRESGMKFCEELLKNNKSPDAIFTTNLEISLGVLITIKKFGLKIPDDIALVGFDDSEVLEYWEPPITVVDQPVYDIGKVAVELLMKKISNKGEKKEKPEVITLKTIFQKRFSTKG